MRFTAMICSVLCFVFVLAWLEVIPDEGLFEAIDGPMALITAICAAALWFFGGRERQ